MACPEGIDIDERFCAIPKRLHDASQQVNDVGARMKALQIQHEQVQEKLKELRGSLEEKTETVESKLARLTAQLTAELQKTPPDPTQIQELSTQLGAIKMGAAELNRLRVQEEQYALLLDTLARDLQDTTDQSQAVLAAAALPASAAPSAAPAAPARLPWSKFWETMPKTFSWVPPLSFGKTAPLSGKPPSKTVPTIDKPPAFSFRPSAKTQDCAQLGLLQNVGGVTCYLDSLMYALLAPNPFTMENWYRTVGIPFFDPDPQTKRQAGQEQLVIELQRVFALMLKESAGQSCLTLRSTLGRLGDEAEIKPPEGGGWTAFFARGERSMADVLDLLLKLLPLRSEYLPIAYEQLRPLEDPIQEKSAIVLPSAPAARTVSTQTLVNEFFQTTTGTRVCWASAPPIFFLRTDRPPEGPRGSVEPSQTVTVPLCAGDQAAYVLLGIAFWDGHVGGGEEKGHYKAAFKCQDQWFLYDDLLAALVPFSLDNLQTDSVLFYYQSTDLKFEEIRQKLGTGPAFGRLTMA